MLQYGLVAGFVSTAILSAISSLGIDLGALFWSLASDVRTVTSSF